MLIKYLESLKEQGHFTIDEIANLSGISKDTVKNVFSGKTKDPGIFTIAPIIFAMGGNLDAVFNRSKKESADANSIVLLKEMYENHLNDVKDHYEHRLSEIKEHYNEMKERNTEMKERHEERIAEINEHIDTIKLDKRWFRFATCILAFALVALLVADILAPGLGWFQS